MQQEQRQGAQQKPAQMPEPEPQRQEQQRQRRSGQREERAETA
jgi:hypothetical protein